MLVTPHLVPHLVPGLSFVGRSSACSDSLEEMVKWGIGGGRQSSKERGHSSLTPANKESGNQDFYSFW